jgi:chemotaxis protein CheD
MTRPAYKPATSGPLATERTTHVVQGHYVVSGDAGDVLSTVLGSCVAACMHDPVARVGGMNHFLVPGGEGVDDSVKYGINAMELLINGLLQRGALRSRLEAKLFGGARVVRGLSDIGEKNAAFAAQFLRSEGIRMAGHSLGGQKARRVRYWPASGRALQLLIDDPGQAIFSSERLAPAPVATGEVDFF